MPRRIKPQPVVTRLPLLVWIVGIGLLGLGVAWSLQVSGRTDQSAPDANAANVNLDPAVTAFTDFFNAGWRGGSPTAPTWIEATYFFPELAAALDGLPAKSSHQGEIADRLAVLKPNVDSLVFYVTIASGADPIDSIEPKNVLRLTDSSGRAYPVRDWVEANAALLPATTVPQRIGLLVASMTANDGTAFAANNPTELILTATGLSQQPQQLRWDLGALRRFLETYER